MPSVAIVEDHLLLAQTLCAALTDTGVLVQIIEPGPLDSVLGTLLANRPDLVLLDLDLGRFGDGTTLIRPLTRAGLRVLVVTGATTREHAALAYEQGAFGYQSKAAGFPALLAKIAAALHSAGPLDATERTDLLTELWRVRADRERELAPFGRLTERERETLVALSEGRSVAHLATDWVVSEATVRTHVRGVLTKLGEPTQLSAVARALRCGWIASQPTPSASENKHASLIYS